jgi:hypothetical protein
MATVRLSPSGLLAEKLIPASREASDFRRIIKIYASLASHACEIFCGSMPAGH